MFLFKSPLTHATSPHVAIWSHVFHTVRPLCVRACTRVCVRVCVRDTSHTSSVLPPQATLEVRMGELVSEVCLFGAELESSRISEAAIKAQTRKHIGDHARTRKQPLTH